MFGHCSNIHMRLTCANYNIACDVIEVRASPTYRVIRAGSALREADRKLIWTMKISGPYPIAPDGRDLLHAANNKYQFAWVCGMVKKSGAAKCIIAAFVATFDTL